MECKHVLCCAGQLEESFAIGDFPPGDYSLDITVIDVYGQSVAHPTLTFTRPDLLEVECSVHYSLAIDCTSSTVVESQICSIDDGFRFDCSLPRDIDELARTFNLTSGDHNLTVMTVDEFGQVDNSLVIFTVRKLNHNCVFIVSASVYVHVYTSNRGKSIKCTVFHTALLEVNCTLESYKLLVFLTCTASNPVSEVFCSLADEPTSPCKYCNDSLLKVLHS